ncbi:polyamine ABC transporter substrate-binding protein [Roseicitreum antarcticum]|uniref:Putrescine-binding periplasmic protein n=1 Tax=Roseicitreum antarcticum TaxID=564137 RepID=A0A1H2WJM8_9RHOB|nr:polyamine ABC transporter substrate-binding protein [Roseicitreum antarcticum]SDW80209.1 putrescine transport system substrate-binding protein [Roseicitreum antarcticum]
MRYRLIVPVSMALMASAAHAQNGSINVFNWSDYITEEALALFTERTGITVNYDVYDSNDTLEARMLAGSSGFDVVVPTSDYMQRQIAAGVYQPLNKDLLPNIVHMDPELLADVEAFDPGNEYGMIYLWGTTGIGYNRQAVAERMGEDYVVDSWSLVFDPEKVALFADCGVSFMDTHIEMLPAAMRYLGLEPTSTDPADMEAAAELIEAVRPHVRYFSSSQYISDLANGETCLAVGWSGDVFQASDRADEAGRGVEVGYAIPDEGTHQWFDMLVIPSDAPNPEGAHAFINFLMDPEVIAQITDYVVYANANASSLEFVDPEILSDPAVFPSLTARENMWQMQPYDSRTDRAATRLWTRVRTGQ